MEVIFILLVGACVGSFLNVCVYRIPENRPIVFAHSSCSHCESRLSYRHMVPIVSYLMNRGRCPHCDMRYSVRYMLVEGTTMVLFLCGYKTVDIVWDFIMFALFTCIGLVIVLIDYDHMIIPNKMIAALGLVFALKVLLEGGVGSDSLKGLFVAVAFSLAISLLGLAAYKRGDVIGAGDVKLIAVLGLILGFHGTIIMLYIGVVLCGLAGVGLILSRKVKDKKIPFGPFLMAGSFISYQYAELIWNHWLGRL